MRKILIVDSDCNFRRVLACQLSEAGFDVRQVEHGDEAVELADREAFSLMLVTLNVPVSRQLAFIQLVKYQQPRLPALVLSAFSTMEFVAAALRFGADEFLEKPCESRQLQEAVLRLSLDCQARETSKRSPERSLSPTSERSR